MTETDLVPEPQPTLDPTAMLAGELTPEKLEAFRKAAFQSVDSFQQLRDWLSHPLAQGAARGVAMWALGRHEDAIGLLADEKSDVARVCLADCHAALGQLDKVEAALPNRGTDAQQALVWLRALDSNNSTDLVEQFAAHQGTLPTLEQTYFKDASPRSARSKAPSRATTTCSAKTRATSRRCSASPSTSTSAARTKRRASSAGAR